jgi:hypothetical protein
MWRRYLIMVMVFVVSLFVLMGSTWAYEQQDLEGTWDVYVWTWSVACPFGNQCWDRCDLTIDSQGNVQPAGTYCYWLGGSAAVNGGALTVSGAGEIQGTIETSDGTLNVYGGAIERDELVLEVNQN